jgi:transposase InsO family protein
VIQAVLMAMWQRDNRAPVILYSDCGCQFTSEEYQRFLRRHNLLCSMSAVGNYADNVAAEGILWNAQARTREPPSLPNPHQGPNRHLRFYRAIP